MINRERLIKVFLDLVRVNSPVFDEVDGMAKVEELFLPISDEVIVDRTGEKFGSRSGNRLFRIKGTANFKYPLLLNAHIDTVATCINVKPIMEDNRIKSDGSTPLGADDKAGITIIYEVVRTLKEQKASMPDIEVLITISEEEGLLGARYFDYSLLKSKMGYVFDCDGSAGKIVVRTPSYNTLKFWLKGMAVHAGVCPERGRSAIQAASKAISKVSLGRLDHETTANIGIIKGGVARNIVPEECYVEGEVRSMDEYKLVSVTNEIEKSFEQECKEIGVDLKKEVFREFNSFKMTPADMPVMLAIMACDELGIRTELAETGGGSDANIFHDSSIQAVNLGFGVENAHANSEYFDIDEAIMACNMMLNIIKRYPEV
jgi:tripeptide aminopeptidase